MATTTPLTPRQRQIKKLLDEGKTPGAIAKKLKISENGIYQHMRRIRAANGEKPKATKRSGTRRTRGATSRRRSTTTRRRPPPKATPQSSGAGTSNAPTPVLREMTPLQAIRHRKGEIESQLKESERRVTEAERTAKTEREAHEKLGANRADELKSLEQAEAALTGKPKRATPKRSQAKRNGAGSKGAGRQAAAQATPAAPPATPEPAQPTPEPEAVPAAPEPVAAVAEERPGVPVDPEFDQTGQDQFGEE